MILQSLPRFSPRLSKKPEGPVVIALGDSDDAPCYLASAHPTRAEGYTVPFMASSLVLDRVRLYGAQAVRVGFADGQWAFAELGLMPEGLEQQAKARGMVPLFLRILGDACDERGAEHALKLRT